ncbi:MAG: hypothetical protein WCX31_08350 [Salinivirgaceae bacterium]
MASIGTAINNLNNFKIFIIALIGSFILYGNTLQNNYALDDAIVITKNEFTKQGVKGISKILTTDSFTGFFGKEKKLVAGGRYRPLSVVSFAVEYQFFGENPAISHLLNLIFYALIVFFIFWVISNLLSQTLLPHQKIISLLAALLFMLHPVHTEVIANIKGRDELFSVLFSLLSFWAVLKHLQKPHWVWMPAAITFLFLAAMSKENSLAFVFIIPLALYFFASVPIKKIASITTLLLVPALIFIIIRQKILGGFTAPIADELMNNPFLDASASQKLATVFYTWIIYFKLLFFPHPFTFDYYPYHIALVGFTNGFVLLMLVLLILLAVIAFKGLKNKTIYSFSIIAFAASFLMVSNLFFPVGTFMNERFIFMPSLFWSLAISALLISIVQKNNTYKFVKPSIWIIVLYLLLFFTYKTIARNQAWKDDLTLFTTDVKTSVNGAKSNCSAGGKLWEYGKTLKDTAQQKVQFNLSEIYLRKAVKIHPTYSDAWLLLGNVLFDNKKNLEESVQCYLNVIQWNPNNENAWQNMDIVLQNSSNKELQLNYYLKANALNQSRYLVNYRLGVLYGRYFGDLNKSIQYLSQATKLDPTKAEAFKDLGTAFGISGNTKEAYTAFKKAVAIDSTDVQTLTNLVFASQQLGLAVEAQEYLKQMEMIKKKKDK